MLYIKLFSPSQYKVVAKIKRAEIKAMRAFEGICAAGQVLFRDVELKKIYCYKHIFPALFFGFNG
jgi:hypothetical protein